ncbi:MAG: CDP-alcohol phosphatidyltransferase family protein [Nitrospinales bacterium]
MFDIEKIHKLPKAHRFFDLNDLWYFPNRWVLRALYPLPVSANQITHLALVMGIISAGFYLSDNSYSLFGASIFLYTKLFLDNVDGNLARLRGEESRFGRFFDSFTDFSVTLIVYIAITWRMVEETSDPSLWLLGGVAMVSGFIQCSYFVFYLVKYTSSVGTYKENRSDETITEEDRKAFNLNKYSRGVYILQWIHNRVYGWQDRLIETLDNISRKIAGLVSLKTHDDNWYSDKLFLTLSSPLCICTNTMALVIFSFMDMLEICFWLIIFLGNGWLVVLQMSKVLRFRINSS